MLISHHSRTSSIPQISSSVATLYMVINLWTTAKCSDPVWSPYQGTGTAHQAEFATFTQTVMIRTVLLLSNTVLIITVCVKVANSTFLVTNKRTKCAELLRYYLYNCCSSGRPCQTWRGTVKSPLNVGLATAYRQAKKIVRHGGSSW